MPVRLRVREIAEQQHIGMEKLSRMADVNKKTVQKIWHNPYEGLTIYTLEKLARALGVRTGDLLEDEPNSP